MATPSTDSLATLLENPLVRMGLLVGGGVLAVALVPSVLKGTLRFTARTAVDIAIRAAPIVIAALLAKEGAETLETA